MLCCVVNEGGCLVGGKATTGQMPSGGSLVNGIAINAGVYFFAPQAQPVRPGDGKLYQLVSSGWQGEGPYSEQNAEIVLAPLLARLGLTRPEDLFGRQIEASSDGHALQLTVGTVVCASWSYPTHITFYHSGPGGEGDVAPLGAKVSIEIKTDLENIIFSDGRIGCAALRDNRRQGRLRIAA